MKPLTAATPHVIVMVGIPGSGKSAFAEKFAQTFKAPYVSQTDVAKAAGIDAENAHDLALYLLSELLKTKQTIILDCPSSLKTERVTLGQQITAAGYKPLFVWVQTDLTESKRRATRKRKNATTFTDDEFDKAVKRFTPPSPHEKAVVISGKHTHLSQIKIVLKHLAGLQPDAIPRAQQRQRSGRSILIR